LLTLTPDFASSALLLCFPEGEGGSVLVGRQRRFASQPRRSPVKYPKNNFVSVVSL